MDRRMFVASTLAAGALWTSARAEPPPLPARVAGVDLPQSEIALLAAARARAASPDFLFNHNMRAFVFGSLIVQRRGLHADPTLAFVTCCFHDMGLLPAFASDRYSFELDGADVAERFARENGLEDESADTVWHAVALHAWRPAVVQRAGAEAVLMQVGASADVSGPPQEITPVEIEEIVRAFPRLNFKAQFIALLTDQCRRKPLSQRGTWLEGLCRTVSPDAWTTSVIDSINRAPFSE